MAKLIVNPTSSSRREIQLPRTLLSIGRDPSNDLVLPDAMVSRRHAVIEYRTNQYFLRDCNSSNGSLVNGDRVSERNLRDGDLVAIGTARLLFREDVDVEDVGAKVVQHPSVPKLQCPGCGADYRKGDLFCRQCGTQLAQSPPKAVCTSCGTAVPLPARFCNACGRPLNLGKDAGGSAHTPPGEESRLDATKPRATPADPEATALPEPESPGASRPPSGEPETGEPVSVRPESPSVAPPAATPSPSSPEPPPPLEAPRPTRSAAAVEPAFPAPRPIVDAPRPAHITPPPPLVLDRPRPVVHAGRAEPRPRELDRPEARPQLAEPASFGRRFVAGAIDASIVLLGQAVLLAPVLLYWWSRELPRNPQDVPFVPILLSTALALLVAVLGGAYYVYFWGVRGATPGKQLLDLAVEGEDGACPIGVQKALARVLGYVLSGAALGIGFLMIAFGGSGLHDRVAGTRVVRRSRG